MLGVIEHGLVWEFLETPPLLSGDGWKRSPQATTHVREAHAKVVEMLSNGAIEEVDNPGTPGFYSRFFVVPKKAQGEWRAILDLRELNEFIQCPKFRMCTAETIRHCCRKGEWATSLDLRDAYLHLPIHRAFRKYLRFVVNGKAYQFRSLPAGICVAPWAWSRLVNILAEFLHQFGIELYLYIDDWLIKAIAKNLCALQTQWVVEVVQCLGFVIHWVKSLLLPTQSLVHLGYHFRWDLGLVKPPLERWNKVVQFLRWFLLQTTCPAVQWQSLLGHLTQLEKLVSLGMVRVRPIQAQLLSHWSPFRGSRSHPVPVTEAVRLCIQWWCLEEHIMGGCPSDGLNRRWKSFPMLHYMVGVPIWRARRARVSGRLRIAHNTSMCWNWKRSVWACSTSGSPFGGRRYSSPRTIRLWWHISTARAGHDPAPSAPKPSRSSCGLRRRGYGCEPGIYPALSMSSRTN